jgi:Protein of unknown function (DUF4242)
VFANRGCHRELITRAGACRNWTGLCSASRESPAERPSSPTWGELGTVCLYQGTSPEKVREQAERTGMPADEISFVADTVIVRPDPVAAAS